MARGRRSGRGRAGRGGEVRRSAGVCVMWRPARVRGACRRGGFRGPAGGARGFEVAGNRRPTPGAGAGARGTVTSTASRDGRHARAPAHFTVWERSGVEVEPSSRATANGRATRRQSGSPVPCPVRSMAVCAIRVSDPWTWTFLFPGQEWLYVPGLAIDWRPLGLMVIGTAELKHAHRV